MTNNDFIILIRNYVFRILNFEEALKKEYNLTDHPFNVLNKIPKSGILTKENEVWNYKVHGSGCTFHQNEIVVRYSIYSNQDNYIVTSSFDFLEFINSLGEQYSKLGITMEQVISLFDEIAKLGIVKKLFEDYSVYEISFKWYNSL
jgi:hypothetical protein